MPLRSLLIVLALLLPACALMPPPSFAVKVATARYIAGDPLVAYRVYTTVNEIRPLLGADVVVKVALLRSEVEQLIAWGEIPVARQLLLMSLLDMVQISLQEADVVRSVSVLYVLDVVSAHSGIYFGDDLTFLNSLDV